MFYTVNLSRDKSWVNTYLSSTLLRKIEENITLKKKVILYLNRRWEFSSLVCKDCQHIYACPRCDTYLSVHASPEMLLCHFCGFQSQIHPICESCKWTSLAKVWVWTQQIESSIHKLFQGKKIFRFDFDTVKNVSQKKEAMEKLEASDIIIGTKMITTGFDFKNIWLIGIILAEQELLIPNYDTEERFFINLKQLIWRTREKDTDIILQSFVPENPAIKSMIESNYKDFFLQTLEERKIFSLPPFTQLVKLEFRNTSKEKSLLFMTRLKGKLDIINQTQAKITLSENIRKKYNQYYVSIHIQWNNIGWILEHIREEIVRNSYLTFEYL